MDPDRKCCRSARRDTGIYSWDYLYTLGVNQDEMWRRYLQRIAEAGASREAQPSTPGQRPHCR
jgi:DUF971 family protein